MQAIRGIYLLRPQLVLGLDPFSEIDVHQIILFDFELAFDRVDEEWQFAASQRVLLGGALHLPQRQPHPQLGQNLTRFLQPDVLRVLDHSFASSAALRYGPVLYMTFSSW